MTLEKCGSMALEFSREFAQAGRSRFQLRSAGTDQVNEQ
jgi:hypothetical protein